jgi:proteasome lid subunit RPN8/RPN11
MDTDNLFQVDEALRKHGLECVGQWHTHPSGDDQPSEPDEERIEGLLHFVRSVGTRAHRGRWN